MTRWSGCQAPVFGLMGGALRLLGRRTRSDRWDRRFLTTAAVLMAVNAAAGLSGSPGHGRGLIAWESARLGLFAALLIGPWAKARSTAPFASPVRSARP
jgi:hypothetical protein